MKKVILFLLAAITLLTGCANREASSIGIIGRADGPTSIIVTGRINWFLIIAVLIILISIILAIVYLIKKKNKRS